MSRSNKLVKRFKSKPKDFTWSELVTMLAGLGYVEHTPGKSGGSRRRFIHEEYNLIINLHKLHPGNVLKAYQVSLILNHLVEEGLL